MSGGRGWSSEPVNVRRALQTRHRGFKLQQVDCINSWAVTGVKTGLSGRHFDNTAVRAGVEKIISIIITAMETNTETNNIQTVSYKKIVSICKMFYNSRIWFTEIDD